MKGTKWSAPNKLGHKIHIQCSTYTHPSSATVPSLLPILSNHPTT